MGPEIYLLIHFMNFDEMNTKLQVQINDVNECFQMKKKYNNLQA